MIQFFYILVIIIYIFISLFIDLYCIYIFLNGQNYKFSKYRTKAITFYIPIIINPVFKIQIKATYKTDRYRHRT